MIDELCKTAIESGNFESMVNTCPEIVGGFFGGTIAAIVIFFILMFVLLLVAINYVYFALAWQTIAKKLNYKRPWLAWIPFADKAMILQLGGFHWAWIFLILIPVFGWVTLGVMLIISIWDIFERREYAGWWIIISVLLAVFIRFGSLFHIGLIGVVAWKDKKIVKVKKVVNTNTRNKKKKKIKKK